MTWSEKFPSHSFFRENTLAYGGDWNPEQWTPETLTEDFQLMQELKVNLMSVGIFSWAKLEPSSGNYDFAWLREILDECHQKGIQVDLATPTAAAPAWLFNTDPTATAVTKSGVRLTFGSRQEHCPTNPTYRQAAKKLVEKLAETFGNHPAVTMWHVNNEYACHTLRCYCDNCAINFQKWLREQYETIENLNSAWVGAFWSNTYTDFTQILPPRTTATFTNPAHELDYYRFADEQLLRNFLTEAEIIRRHSPNRPITTNFMGEFPALDYAKWAEHLDLISDDDYPDPANPAAGHQVAFNSALMRGYAGDQPFILMEQTTAAVQWRKKNTPKRPGQHLLWSLSRVAHGANGILQFQWRQSPGGAETFHSAMVNHSGKSSFFWEETALTGQVLQQLNAVSEEFTSHSIAVLTDADSARARHLSVGPKETPLNYAAARAWHKALWEKNLPADVVAVRQLLKQNPNRYQVIIVPDIFIDYPELAQHLEKAAAAGAQIIVTKETGVVDCTLKAILGGYLGSLKNLLGVKVTDHRINASEYSQLSSENGVSLPYPKPDPRVNHISSAVGIPGADRQIYLDTDFAPLQRALEKIGKPTPRITGFEWGEYVVATQPASETTLPTWLNDEVEVIAQFSGQGGNDLAGWPAITRRQVGKETKGAAWYVATDLDEVGKAALLEVVCAYARISPTAVDLPAGVEVTQRGNVRFYLNHSDKSVQLAGVSGFELTTQREATGHVMLPPRTAIAVAIPSRLQK
ncbi:beta-galactosidase [Gleimia sp. 6138-11-ORH1]|uniref:beta-galactosidase n=1 Tax=Gleimia sp. 6138-11-ORH1 TaxID=2973937 RepID=UPI00216915FD|nr:beta-galactosidase [Gleimia sp. 6138-11-ORH1]MCS4483887.1 beta-galactosidase [Gleimia sp. 6138-11-ORH1]